MTLKFTPIEYEQLYGALKPDLDPLTRVHDDAYMSLIALINLYGGMWRAPIRTLSWPLDVAKGWQQLAQRYDNAHSQALAMRDRGETGDLYQDALRRMIAALAALAESVRKDARRLRHYHLSGYAQWVGSRLRHFAEPQIEILDGRMKDKLTDTCRQARRRFADLAVKHGVQFDPPRIDPQHEYQPENRV